MKTCFCFCDNRGFFGVTAPQFKIRVCVLHGAKVLKKTSLMGSERVAGANLEETTPYGRPTCGGPTPAGKLARGRRRLRRNHP